MLLGDEGAPAPADYGACVMLTDPNFKYAEGENHPTGKGFNCKYLEDVFGWDCHGADCHWENPLYSEHLRNHYESGVKRTSDVIITKPGGSCNFGLLDTHDDTPVVKGHYFTRDYELNDPGADFVQGRDYTKKEIPTLTRSVEDEERNEIKWIRAEFGPDDNPGDRDLNFSTSICTNFCDFPIDEVGKVDLLGNTIGGKLEYQDGGVAYPCDLGKDYKDFVDFSTVPPLKDILDMNKNNCPFNYTDLNRHFKEYGDIYYSHGPNNNNTKKTLLDVWQPKRDENIQSRTKDPRYIPTPSGTDKHNPTKSQQRLRDLKAVRKTNSADLINAIYRKLCSGTKELCNEDVDCDGGETCEYMGKNEIDNLLRGQLAVQLAVQPTRLLGRAVPIRLAGGDNATMTLR